MWESLQILGVPRLLAKLPSRNLGFRTWKLGAGRFRASGQYGSMLGRNVHTKRFSSQFCMSACMHIYKNEKEDGRVEKPSRGVRVKGTRVARRVI